MRVVLVLTLFALFLAACGPEPEVEPQDPVILCGTGEVMATDASGMTSCQCQEGLVREGDGCVEPMEPEPEPDPDPEEILPRTLPLSCWLPPGSFCDPRNGSGCDTGAGETCDVATKDDSVRVMCLPGPNTQGEGQACDVGAGPFCAHGLRCTSGVCRPFCCDDSDCPAGQTCNPMSDAGALGSCIEGAAQPMCAGPGGFCQAAGDCCSGNCHVGHCH